MIFEKLWKIKIPDDTIGQIKDVLFDIETTKHLSILSGHFNQLAEWTPVQLLVLDNPIKHDNCIQFMLENGLDLNICSKKGVDFYHLFLISIFYRIEFQTEEYIHYFLDFFRYGNPQESVFFCREHVYTLFDTLCKLQKNPILPNNFYPKYVSILYQPLCTKLFDKLYVSFLCFNCQFHIEKPNYYLDSIEIKNCIPYLKTFPVLKDYVVQKYKLPLYLTPHEIQKRIILLHHWKNFLELYFQTQNLSIPISNENEITFEEDEKGEEEEEETEKQYLNPQLIETHLLRDYEFFEHSSKDDNTIFHKNYLPILLQTKKHPHNRNIFHENEIQIWLQEIHNFHAFPINSLIESFDFYPYFFGNLVISEQNFTIRKWFERLNLYFNIHHPYNQIMNIRFFEYYEVKYIAQKLSRDITSLRFLKKIIKNKKQKLILLLCKKLEFYCSRNEKYVNIIHFVLEEIIQDLKCYKKVKDYLHDTESNSFFIYDEYVNRFGNTNSEFLKRFIQNLLEIYKFNLRES
jgi:hypothetical protein